MRAGRVAFAPERVEQGGLLPAIVTREAGGAGTYPRPVARRRRPLFGKRRRQLTCEARGARANDPRTSDPLAIRERSASDPRRRDPRGEIAPAGRGLGANIGYNGDRPVMLWIALGFVVAMMVGFLVPRKPLSLNLKPSSAPRAPDGDPPADPKNGS